MLVLMLCVGQLLHLWFTFKLSAPVPVDAMIISLQHFSLLIVVKKMFVTQSKHISPVHVCLQDCGLICKNVDTLVRTTVLLLKWRVVPITCLMPYDWHVSNSLESRRPYLSGCSELIVTLRNKCIHRLCPNHFIGLTNWTKSEIRDYEANSQCTNKMHHYM